MIDLIIIGAGPGGMTASIYAARAGKSVKIFEKNAIGGQIASSPKVENFPGFKSISGMELACNLSEQAEALGVEFEFEDVKKIIDNGKTKTIVTDEGQYDSKAIIIATGAKHRQLGIENEEKYIGNGVAYCVVCDGEFYSGQDVAIVGGGNTALQSAIYLSKICKSVTIIQLLDKLTGEKQLVQDVQKLNNVKILLNASVTKLNGEISLENIDILQNGETKTLQIKGLFVSIGQIPASTGFDSVSEINNQGYIVASENCQTSTRGIFVAGDVRTKQFRQITTACADGTIAAITACSYIDSLS